MGKETELLGDNVAENNRVTSFMLNEDEFIPHTENGQKGETKAQTVHNEAEWISSMRRTNPQVLDEETFITLINDSRTVMKSGTQAWNSYGKLTNMDLLVHYGFCFKNNLYDSFKQKLSLDIDFTARLPGIQEMIGNEQIQKSRIVQDIRFKRYQFNEVLIAYIRMCFKETWDKEHFPR